MNNNWESHFRLSKIRLDNYGDENLTWTLLRAYIISTVNNAYKEKARIGSNIPLSVSARMAVNGNYVNVDIFSDTLFFLTRDLSRQLNWASSTCFIRLPWHGFKIAKAPQERIWKAVFCRKVVIQRNWNFVESLEAQIPSCSKHFKWYWLLFKWDMFAVFPYSERWLSSEVTFQSKEFTVCVGIDKKQDRLALGVGVGKLFFFFFVWVRMIVVVLVVLCSVFDVGFHSNEICLLCSVIWALAFSEVTFESKELTICVGGDNRILLFGGGDRGTFFLFFFPLVWVMMVVTEVLCSIFVILISFLGLASHWVLRTQKFRYPLPRTHTYHSFFSLSFSHGVVLHASSAARNCTLLISVFLFHSASCVKILSTFYHLRILSGEPGKLVSRTPDSWSKNCELESRQERRENFLL